MKILSLMAGMLILFFASTISPTSLNGRFLVLNADNLKLAVKLQINTETGSDDLGGATIVIGFDKTVLNFNSIPADQIDYKFHNFSNGNYREARVTKPMLDRLWINIDLPPENNNKGTIAAGSNGWTDVVTLYFDIVNSADTIKLNWLNANIFWSVYDADNKSLWSNGVFTNLIINPVLDTTPPDITDVTASNSKSVTIKFSEKLNSAAAKDKNNYKISNGVLINQVQLLPDSSSVLLKTSQQLSGIGYSLTISGIKDQYDNLQSPNPKTAVYQIAQKGKGGRVKNSITSASATSWDQNYSPDKSIDGFGLSTPDSRWQSAGLMPDTLTYDLSKEVSLDSLRISFYKGESGRLYKYSVYSSNDLNNWNSIVDDLWSEESEWTEIEFDSTKGRYVKLILKDSNQGNKAGIWEFESFGADINKIAGDDNTIPDYFELSQNYPNPFNPSTKIRYTIPTPPISSPLVKGRTEEGLVVLKVYDILGNEVATLVNEVQEPGQHEVLFDAAGLASGIYVYRIQIAAYIDTKKMVLLR